MKPYAFLSLLVDILGLRLKDQIALDERVRHIRVTTWIALLAAIWASYFNLNRDGMHALGAVELGAVVLLLLPATWLSNKPAYVGVAENLMLMSTVAILGALIVFGGVSSTGVLWVFSAPFMAFFITGQRRGWWFSVCFIAAIAIYLAWLAPLLPFAYSYSPVFATHFVLALCFYTLTAAAFNQLRTRFEEHLQQRVEEKTADAKALLAQLQYLASHDTVTGLPNKVLLIDILKNEMRGADANERGLLICTLHLERFFELANVIGNAGSDKLVGHIASHLGRLTQANGVLARTGRDEFVIAYRLPQAALDPAALERFITQRQFSIEENGYTLYVEFTLGLAVYPDHAQDAQDLLTKADQAMLQARKDGQQWNIYDADQEQVFVRHHLLFGQLREALHKQRLQVHYQAQIDMATGRILGAEALTRWNDPVAGMVPPAVFIPVAEQSGLIRTLTTWLIGECMRECARWQRLGLDLDISINISARNLMDPELMGVLQAGLEQTGLQPGRVNLEITESCFMASPERVMDVIQRIHDAGFRLSIDDFGTGYSSLSYIRSLPIDELKIDQSFVRTVLFNPGDQAIISSTIELAHRLNLSVVAEGIEDQETADWLQARGCDIGQGYHYSRPLPSDAFEALAHSLGTGRKKAA
jgi:diguanylate cyclase (GGDEF)-like protein